MIYSKEGILDKNFQPVDPETEIGLLENKELNTTNKTYFKPTDNFMLNILPDKSYNTLREMGESNISITRWLNNALKSSLIAVVISAILGVYVNHLFLAGVVFFPIYMVMSKIKFINTAYSQWRFERRIQFNKFVRLVIPYLKQTESDISIYSILGKIVPRLDNEEDRNLLQVLRRGIIDQPKEIEPFLEYSRKTANTNLSDNFMSSLYDIRMGSNDLRGIYALGVTASEQLLHSIDQIIEMKIKKFAFYPTKLTFATIVPIIGFAVSYMIYELSHLNIGGGI